MFDNSSRIFQLAGGQTYMYGLVWNYYAVPRCWWVFIRYYLGINMAFLSDEECVAVAATEMYTKCRSIRLTDIFKGSMIF